MNRQAALNYINNLENGEVVREYDYAVDWLDWWLTGGREPNFVDYNLTQHQAKTIRSTIIEEL